MTKPNASRADRPARAVRFYPDTLMPAIQETFAILADLDFGHRTACETLDAWDGPPDEKDLIARDLEARYAAVRQPYEERLEALRDRAGAIATPPTLML